MISAEEQHELRRLKQKEEKLRTKLAKTREAIKRLEEKTLNEGADEGIRDVGNH